MLSSFRLGILLVSVGCGCPDFRTTTPSVTPQSACLQIQASTKRQGASCAQAFVTGTNGCAVALVFPAGSLTTPGPTTFAAGETFSVTVTLPPDDTTYPIAYSVDAMLGTDPIEIEFEVSQQE